MARWIGVGRSRQLVPEREQAAGGDLAVAGPVPDTLAGQPIVPDTVKGRPNARNVASDRRIVRARRRPLRRFPIRS
jgi:hypothetical protein